MYSNSSFIVFLVSVKVYSRSVIYRYINNYVLSKIFDIYFRHRKADTGKPRGENRETSKTVPAFQKLFLASDLFCQFIDCVAETIRTPLILVSNVSLLTVVLVN